MANKKQSEQAQLQQEIDFWEHSESEKGQVYTRPSVIDFMLDCLGLKDGRDFTDVKILEPSCGEGEFVAAIARRLLYGGEQRPNVDDLLGKVLAIDVVGRSLDVAKSKVEQILGDRGYSRKDIQRVVADWFIKDDFLLRDIEATFTHVIGNPPYVRVENIPKGLLAEYRKRFKTMADRADLYIPFFEKSLSLLRQRGKLSFICTDRWTKNNYGKSLRQFIHDGFSLELYVDLYGSDSFEQVVLTYPAITQIVKSKGRRTVLMHNSDLSPSSAVDCLNAMNGAASALQVRTDVVTGAKPWLLGAKSELSLIRRLEQQFPTLEEAGCEVFIGAATGANNVYVVDRTKVDIEASRLLPVITAQEIKAGDIRWKGRYLINTYDEKGVVDLSQYPKLAAYLQQHKAQLCERHVAGREPEKWYRTIDRVYENRAKAEKLLIPDISNTPIVVYDKGNFHPNNSIYFICSSTWDLHALRVILLSNVTTMFIAAYSTKIANGYLRFQAQHLRKLRIPRWDDVPVGLKKKLVNAGTGNDVSTFATLAAEMYQLDTNERLIVGV